MHTRFKSYLLVALLTGLCAAPAYADEIKPDDSVVFDLSAENWVTTKTARVMLNVEAAVSGNTAGNMRATMTKSVNDVVKGDWRLTSFNRSQDSTGMERWSATYESRIAESDLNGLHENAKKQSKAGMQITVSGIDFTPTLEENQAAAGQLRTQIYKQATEQLTALNTAIPGRSYRIAAIDFAGGGGPMFAARQNYIKSPLRMAAPMAMGGAAEMDSASATPMERSEKMTITAHVVLSAVPPMTATK